MRFLWQARVEENRAGGIVPDGDLLDAGSTVWQAVHHLTQATIEGYREQQASRIRAREHERSAMLQALLEGRPGTLARPRKAGRFNNSKTARRRKRDCCGAVKG
ncbi:hypothetical protein [Amycolatopsis sp. FDAARGOS 1241]|uniref:hypothetical protein n=1 Tax=Amycolatopsis sp. FDAARGOS 1241 TaxID=2778070 RepID=UPI0019527A1A|nr:hypothetical protein [Amycolatopsis sp. FDAARGOS 1241]QRP50406.1 hypothetical protein I6J71_23565 [Amycolatopsis sp. FDAARGOS 1241]